MYITYIYVYGKRGSLSSQNIWSSESEKLERSEFVVVCWGKHQRRDKLTVVSELVQDNSDDDYEFPPLHADANARVRGG